MRVMLIAAVAENGVIGRAGGLPWRLPADLKRFQMLTRGFQVVMGRRTFESLPGALPDRRNIVVTSTPGYRAPGIVVAGSLDEALSLAEAGAVTREETLWILGGAALYAAALPIAVGMDLTRVEATVEGDTFFPEVEWGSWRLESVEHHQPDERHAYPFRFERWERAG